MRSTASKALHNIRRLHTHTKTKLESPQCSMGAKSFLIAELAALDFVIPLLEKKVADNIDDLFSVRLCNNCKSVCDGKPFRMPDSADEESRVRPDDVRDALGSLLQGRIVGYSDYHNSFLVDIGNGVITRVGRKKLHFARKQAADSGGSEALTKCAPATGKSEK